MVKNKYTGMSVFVDCGVCPACQQKKRNYQKFLFGNNTSGYVLFCTLTYDNLHIPYVLDVLSPESLVYRNGNFIGSFKNKYFDSNFVSNGLTNCFYSDSSLTPGVGVLWQKDISDFFKRFKRFCERRSVRVSSYFYVREYGSNYARPHFHVCFFIEESQIEFYKCAVIANWKMCNWSSLPLSEAFKFVPASTTKSYVTSYVNKSLQLPIFLTNKSISQKTWHTHFFGFEVKCFKFENFWDSACKYSVTYNKQILLEGSPVVTSVLYPKYVVGRYFPKIKGYSRLNFHAFLRIYKYGFSRYDCKLLDYSIADVKRNNVLINRCYSLACQFDIDYDYFLFVMWKFYILYACYLIKSCHYNSDGSQLPMNHLLTCYLNLPQYLHNRPDRLRLLSFNPNFTDVNISEHYSLISQFNQSLDNYCYKSHLKKYSHG